MHDRVEEVSSDNRSGGAHAESQTPKIDVLLATYNSARYLAPLLESLLAQSWSDFQLIISDDCSSDETLTVIEQYLKKFRHLPRIIRRTERSGSAKANFASLMQVSDGDFVFLCDADDVWHNDKIERFVVKAEQIEAQIGPSVPLFVFSDAGLIDAEGRSIGDSYWAFKKIAPARCLHLERLLICPPMLGCASLMNRALVQFARDVPVDRVTGHDWWAILVAACTGRIYFIDAPTISYRIHGNNSSQPKEISVTGLARLATRASRMKHEVRRRMAIRYAQAEPLREQLDSLLSDKQRVVLNRFLSLSGRKPLRRRLMMFWHGYTYPDKLRNLALLLFA